MYRYFNLQLFADPAPAAPQGGNTEPTPAQSPAPAPAVPAAPQRVDMEAFAQALVAAVQSGTAKKEAAITKSMAAQYGMSDEEAAAILEKAKAEKAKQLPPEAQAVIDAQLQKANTLLISAEIKAQGAALGLLDADAALALLSAEAKARLKVDDKGQVAGVKEALEDLKATKPYLFGSENKPPEAWGQRHGQTPSETTARDEMKKQMFGG